MEQPVTVNFDTDEQGRRIFAITTKHGSLDATFRPEIAWFCIANVDVERRFRGRGTAKMLLEQSIKTAKENEAALMYSAITSRECLDAMTTVFGLEAIKVTEQGTYTPDGEVDRHDTSAALWLILDEQA